MPRHYQNNDRPTPEQSFEDIVLGKVHYENDTGFISRTVLQLPAEPVKQGPVRPAPIVPTNKIWDAVNYCLENITNVYNPTGVIMMGHKFILGFTKDNFLTKVMWSLFLCLISLTVNAQSPMIGQCHEYMYTLDQETLCLFNHETDQEQTFCLSPSEAYWDSNGIRSDNTPLFPTKGYYEPAWMVRWVTFYNATNQETGEVYQVIINFEWYKGEPHRITLIRISHLQYWE